MLSLKGLQGRVKFPTGSGFSGYCFLTRRYLVLLYLEYKL